MYCWLPYPDDQIARREAHLIPAVQTLAHSPRELTEEDWEANKEALLKAYHEYAAALAVRAAARSALCKRTTELFAKLCAPFTWVGRQAAIMGSYLWAFTKAKKAGVCPYLKFHD